MLSSISDFVQRRRDRRAARDAERGYSVSKGRLTLAYVIELFVIAASLYGAWLFANQYGHDDRIAIHMMMLAPLGYAIIEFCRVPLAYSTRTQTSRVLRVLAACGVIASAGVTVKSMSQLGEIMFRPRLVDVAHARQDLKQAASDRDVTAKLVADADDAVGRSKSDVDGAQKRVTDASADLGKLPPNRCSVVTRRNSKGQPFQTQVCSTDPRIASMNVNLKTASDALSEARGRLERDVALRKTLDLKSAEDNFGRAKVRYDQAISRSQLHSFTAMVFGKDPQEVNDGEVAEFLRVFVFVPAFLVAFAATSLAVTSVHTVPKRPVPVTVPDEAAGYILGPYVQTIIEEATASVRADQERVVAEAVARARGPVEEPAPEATEVVVEQATPAEPAAQPENVVRMAPKRDV